MRISISAFGKSLKNWILASLIFFSPVKSFADSFVEKYFSDNQGRRADVLVNQNIYPELDSIVTEYAKNMEEDSFDVKVYSCDVGSAESLRTFLQDEWQNDSITNVFLVGDFPAAWFQYVDNWGYEEEYEYFPTETFLKELDGTWEDNFKEEGGILVPGQDGIYDTHVAGSGDLTTEISLGRLPANQTYGNGIWGDEIERISNYLEKNISYRDSEWTGNDNVLMYFDDEIAGLVNTSGVELAYDDVTVINDSNETTADDYKQKLTDGYEWIWVSAHSGSSFHKFYENNGNGSKSVWNFEIPDINPQTPYYFVNGCGSGKFITPDFMLGHYVLSSDKGLAAVGYTGDAIGTKDYENFWRVISDTGSVGEALKASIDSTFAGWPEPELGQIDKYGMTLIGDPTLKPKKDYEHNGGIAEEEAKGLEYVISPSIVGNSFEIDFSGDGNINPKDVSVSIYDVAGRQVSQKPLDSYSQSGNDRYRVDVSDFSSGAYIVRVGNGEGKKIVKLK